MTWDPLNNQNDPLIILHMRHPGSFDALVAPFNSCILNGREKPGTCTPPPRDGGSYEYAHVGPGGSAIIPMGLSHADLNASASAAASHYADTGYGAVIAEYREDADAIWASGDILPGLSDRDLKLIEHAALSGDWRWIEEERRHRMIASQIVLIPGFRPANRFAAQRPQFALAASAGEGAITTTWYYPEVTAREQVITAIMAAATAHYPAGTSGGKGGQFAPGHPAYGTRQVLVSKLKAAGYTGPTSYPMNRLRAIADAHAAKTGVNVTTATGLTPGQQVAANIMATRAQPTNTPAPSAAFIAGRLAAQQTAPQPNAAFLAAQAITQRSMSQSPGLAPAQAVVTPVSTAGMKRTQLVAHLRSTGYTGPVSYNTDKLRDIIARRAGGVYTPAATAPAAPKTIPGSTLGTTVERFGATDRSVASHVKTIDVHTPAGLDEFNLIAAHVGVQGVTAADVAAITQHGQQTGYGSRYLRDDLSKALIARQALADLAADPKMRRNAMITLAGNSGAYIARKNASADAIRADLVKQFGVRAKPNLQRHADAARRAIADKAKADAVLQAAMASVGGGTQQGIGGLGKVLPKDFAHAAYAGDKGHPTPAGYTNRGRAVQQVASAYSVLGHDVARPHEFVDSLTELSTRDDIRTVVYRGVKGYRAGDAQKHVQQMASGTHYVGDGIYGQGTYSSPSKSTAAGYAGGTNGLLMAFGIRKDAKIVKHSDVAMVQNALYASGDLRGLDIGTVAMMMGADVMQVDDGTNHHVIYNRTALVMVRPDANGKFKN